MHKIKGIFVSTLLLLSLLAIIAPVSAGTIHVYPGDDLEAIVEAAPAGSTIYVHAGTYILVDDIRIGQDNITLIGDGATTTIIERDLDAVPGPSMLIGIDGVKNVTITGFTFKNSNDSAIYLETSTANATISNNIIVDGSYRGILGWNNVTGTIKNNLILRCAYHGISVRSNVTIINNSVISCKGGGIYIDNGADATIKNNIIVSNETFGIGADLGGGNPIINIE
ncbi:MAG: hypothetical protein GYA51_11335, partial [Candidatus Methanofastidiosa archaeon]|nr:hypothetical protein [Candidatus Methanofastidiosa archaeon]